MRINRLLLLPISLSSRTVRTGPTCWNLTQHPAHCQLSLGLNTLPKTLESSKSACEGVLGCIGGAGARAVERGGGVEEGDLERYLCVLPSATASYG